MQTIAHVDMSSLHKYLQGNHIEGLGIQYQTPTLLHDVKGEVSIGLIVLQQHQLPPKHLVVGYGQIEWLGRKQTLPVRVFPNELLNLQHGDSPVYLNT